MNRSATQFIGSIGVISLLLAGCAGTPAALRSEAHLKAEQLLQRGIRSAHKQENHAAEKWLRESLTISTSIDDTGGRFTAGLNLARLYRLEHRLAEAEQQLSATLALPERAPHTNAEGEYELALLKLAQGDTRQALASAQQAYQDEEERYRGRPANLISRILLQQGHVEAAKGEALEALVTNQQAGEEEETANSHYLLGEIARRSQEYQVSRHYLQEALVRDKLLGIPGKIARDLMSLAETAQAAGASVEALVYRQRASELLKAAALASQTNSSDQLQPATTSPSNKP